MAVNDFKLRNDIWWSKHDLLLADATAIAPIVPDEYDAITVDGSEEDDYSSNLGAFDDSHPHKNKIEVSASLESDASSYPGMKLECSNKSKVYLSPKLWYLRIKAQDIVPGEKGSTMSRFPKLSAKAQVKNQVLKTRVAPAMPNRSFLNPFWNEDTMFIIAEPFRDYLMLFVEDRFGLGRNEVLGLILIPVTAIECRTDDKVAYIQMIYPRYTLQHGHGRTKSSIQCFSLAPKWNEQYTWEVFDPCTVITIGVLDNSHTDKSAGAGVGARDSHIGKFRICLSTLESDWVYTHAYHLLMLDMSGVKKMRKLHLALRFTCANMANVLHMYTLPLLPNMHYVQPLLMNQLESLGYQGMNVVAARWSRAEAPLGREVVEYMLDHDSHMWSMRCSKANFFSLVLILRV
ncbi:hypothetical protein NE237_016473 [Protea cynaroides]|uniref:C2 domain-containing protein n=1 Tax=Protea cynaroides TaxID=273540 RepID=A0A9Q0K5J0_9MAGN|nr:hypothetical protein NE237_016473 [Protea cynaroides]